MNKSTKNTLRIISFILAVVVTLMHLDVIPNIIVIVDHFWTLVIAYFLLVLSMR